MYISDINRIFTEEVAKYLNDGWTINAQTMHGIYSGQIAKVDVTDGKRILRIELTEDRGYTNDHEYYVAWISLTISEEVSADSKPNERIIFDEWNAISERRFYEMEKRHFYKHGAEWYVEDFGEIADAIEHYKERRKLRRGNTDDRIFYPITKSILPLVRRFPRCKSVHLEDIESVYSTRNRFDKRSYHFVVKGKTRTIEMH